MMKSDFAFILSSDLFRLKKLKSVFVALILMFLILTLIFAVSWIGLNLTDRLEVGEGVAEVNGVTVDADGNPVITQQDKDEMAALFTQNIRDTLFASGSASLIEIFMMIIVCIFVGKDFSNGTMRLLISRGTNRLHAFFSKWLSMAILVVIYSLFSLLICGILFSIKNGGFGSSDFGTLARCFFLQLLVNLSLMSIFFMIAFLCRSSGAALGMSIGLYIILQLVLTVISTVSEISGGSTAWVAFMPLQQMSVATSSEAYSTTELCSVIIMPIVYIAVSIATALATFLKRDIK